MIQDHHRRFFLLRVAHALPGAEVVSCVPDAGGESCRLHLRDPESQAELILPVSGQWVERIAQECPLECDCSQFEFDCPLDLAAKILGVKRPTLAQSH
jgi:hypothetical protein